MAAPASEVGAMRASATAAAFGLHLLLLGAPLALAGRLERAREPAVWCWLALALALQAVELRATRAHDDGPDGPPLDRALAALTAALLLLVQWVAAWGALPVAGLHAGALPLAGGLCMLAGVALRAAAFARLGDAFVSSPDGRAGAALEQQGIYAWLRHPSETGLLLVATGAALLLGSGLALALSVALLLPLVVWRCHREDAALRAVFGEAHARWSASTGGLLPRLRPAT